MTDVAPQPAAQGAADNNNGGILPTISTLLFRIFLVITVMRFIGGTGLFGGSQTANIVTGPNIASPSPQPTITGVATCAFARSSPLLLQLYISNSSDRKAVRKLFDTNPSSTITDENQISITRVWNEKPIYFDDRESNNRNLTLEFNNQTSNTLAPYYDLLINNQSVHLHAFLQEINNLKKERILHITYPINRYIKVKKSKKRNLLYETEAQKQQAENATLLEEEIRYVSHYNPTMNLALVDFRENVPLGSVPAHFRDALHLLPGHGHKQYYPVLYFNDFWTIKDHLKTLNETVESVPLQVELTSVTAWKWQFYLQMEESLKMQSSFGTSDEADHDEIKRMLLETNPYLLAVTILVSILHSVFDFLAFKNDIQFYKNKKTVEGLSIRAIFMNCFFQTVVLLYLFDNDTSYMILISSGIGLLIEYWKITKVVDVSLKRTQHFPYFIEFKDKSGYVTSKTKEYDDEAIKYLSYVLYPLILGYAIYSLFNNEFKSWYSFVLSTIVGFIYMFGFLNLVPQVYINYKLQSVAAMPWKAFTYKALNTFVDDLFAFVIKMPTLHRIACFRDDVIFFIYLYQRWKYPIDTKRVNEFGQGGEDEEETKPKAVESTTNDEDKSAASKDEEETNIVEQTSEDGGVVNRKKKPTIVETDSTIPSEASNNTDKEKTD